MEVSLTIPETIGPYKDDIPLEYFSSLSLKAFAARLPNNEFHFSDHPESHRQDPQKIRVKDHTPEVYQYHLDSPGFIISPSFDGVQNLVRELDLPTEADELYFSKLWGAGDFVGAGGPSFTEYQKYSVETFGVRVRSVPESFFSLDFYAPDLAGDLPRYWLTPCLKLIQIRRVRVFSRSLEWMRGRSWGPVTGDLAHVLYLEERWHPLLWDTLSLQGLKGRGVSNSLQIERFYRIGKRILARTPNFKGRPQGSGQYPIGSEFYRVVKRTYELLYEKRGRPPLKKEIAAELKLSSSGFRIHWRTTSRIWPPI